MICDLCLHMARLRQIRGLKAGCTLETEFLKCPRNKSVERARFELAPAVFRYSPYTTAPSGGFSGSKRP